MSAYTPIRREMEAAWPADGAAGEGKLALRRWTDLDEADHARWDELGQQTAVANVFCQPWMVRPALAHCDPRQQVTLAIVSAEDGAWQGVLPMASSWSHGRAPMPNWQGWLHANQFVGTPLIRRGCEHAFWRALLDGLDRFDSHRIALCIPCIPRDDPVARALGDICDEQRRPLRHDREWSRPYFGRDAGDGARSDARLRRRIAGLERKLEREWGKVSFAISSDPAAIDDLVDPFLALERGGWKGRAGSALACQKQTDAFFRSAARAAARRDRFAFATLRAGGQVLAISSFFRGPAWQHGFKMAYDERAAACAPGVVLLDRLTRDLHDSGGAPMDSCASDCGNPVSRLWPLRREFVDCCVALGGPGRRALFETMAWAEQVFHAVKPRKTA